MMNRQLKQPTPSPHRAQRDRESWRRAECRWTDNELADRIRRMADLVEGLRPAEGDGKVKRRQGLDFK